VSSTYSSAFSLEKKALGKPDGAGIINNGCNIGRKWVLSRQRQKHFFQPWDVYSRIYYFIYVCFYFFVYVFYNSSRVKNMHKERKKNT